jgi:hypothetical protein
MRVLPDVISGRPPHSLNRAISTIQALSLPHNLQQRRDGSSPGQTDSVFDFPAAWVDGAVFCGAFDGAIFLGWFGLGGWWLMGLG